MKTLLALLLALNLQVSTKAATITLAWDGATPDEEVTKYAVYEETSPNFWVKLMEVTDPQAVIQNVVAGKHTYAVTAFNIWAESLMSDPVRTPKNVSNPKGLKILSITLNVSP